MDETKLAVGKEQCYVYNIARDKLSEAALQGHRGALRPSDTNRKILVGIPKVVFHTAEVNSLVWT